MTFFQDLGQNLRLFLRAVTFRRIDPGAVIATPGQVALAFAVMATVNLGVAAWNVWPVGGVSFHDLTLTLGFWFWLIVVLTFGLIVVQRGWLVPAALVVIPWALAVSTLLGAAGMAVATAIPEAMLASAILTGLLVMAPPVATASRLLGPGVLPGLLRAVPLLVVLVAGQVALARGMMYLPQPFYSARSDEAQEDWQRVDVESLYYAQPALMEQAIAGLAPQRPGQTDVYALMLGGTSWQGVFLSEVEKGAAILEETHDTAGRTLRLANSGTAPERYPMANRHNLAAALAAMAQTMDPAEDIAFLYLSSHGSTDHFALNFWEAGTRGLSAADLAAMLDDSGLKNAVIVISACHSGSFIDDLQAPDRVIITASAAEKRSFGCGDKNEWTWWGEAYFEHGLRGAHDFRAAFDIAAQTVTEWENAAGYTASEPQIAVGAEIAARLDAWATEPPVATMAGAD